MIQCFLEFYYLQFILMSWFGYQSCHNQQDSLGEKDLPDLSRIAQLVKHRKLIPKSLGLYLYNVMKFVVILGFLSLLQYCTFSSFNSSTPSLTIMWSIAKYFLDFYHYYYYLEWYTNMVTFSFNTFYWFK